MGPIGTAALGIGTGLAEGAAEQIFGEMNQKRELRGQKKLWNNRMPQLESVEAEVSEHMTIGELIKEHEGVSGIQFSTDEHGNVQAAYIRGKHGGMKLVSMGDGLENVSSKI